jgi:pyridoxamine 5'-phosphate oxidase
MMKNTDISKLRRDYLLTELNETNVKKDPFDQLNVWMEETIKSNLIDPSAMILATANKNAEPSVRVVLLKGIDAEGLIFFTNYESRKGKDISENPQASLLFFWKELERQVRISGKVKEVSKKESEDYFHSRPYESQLAALASKQSSIISDRQYLEGKFEELKKEFNGKEIPLPSFWGGFKLIPESFEFWQGRENRLHDRISYMKGKRDWKIVRLAP